MILEVDREMDRSSVNNLLESTTTFWSS